MHKLAASILLALSLGIFTPAAAATITGTVRQGAPDPPRRKVLMFAQDQCNAYNMKHPHYVQDVVANNHRLQYVFVYVKSGSGLQASYPPPPPVSINQQHCWYDPHAVALMVGQKLQIVNSDENVTHNIRMLCSLNAPRDFKQAGPLAGQQPTEIDTSFDKPEIFYAMCNIHHWMHAVIGVFSNPYYAVTDGNGNFTIPGLPAGTYQLEAWQEKYGTKTMTVTVSADENKTVEFDY